LERKLSIQCPCGHIFEGLTDELDAIVRVRLHFDLFHRNFLPFGITKAEVLGLLKKE
jgi:hypothetical protein